MSDAADMCPIRTKVGIAGNIPRRQPDATTFEAVKLRVDGYRPAHPVAVPATSCDWQPLRVDQPSPVHLPRLDRSRAHA